MYGGIETRIETNGGVVVKPVSRPRNIGAAVSNISVTGCGVYDIGVAADALSYSFGEVPYRHRLTGADVVCVANVLGLCGQSVCLNHVVDVNEVACLCTVTVNRDWVTISGLISKDVDDTGIVATGLVRSVNIEIPKCDGLDAVELVVQSREVIDG